MWKRKLGAADGPSARQPLHKEPRNLEGKEFCGFDKPLQEGPVSQSIEGGGVRRGYGGFFNAAAAATACSSTVGVSLGVACAAAMGQGWGLGLGLGFCFVLNNARVGCALPMAHARLPPPARPAKRRRACALRLRDVRPARRRAGGGGSGRGRDGTGRRGERGAPARPGPVSGPECAATPRNMGRQSPPRNSVAGHGTGWAGPGGLGVPLRGRGLERPLRARRRPLAAGRGRRCARSRPGGSGRGNRGSRGSKGSGGPGTERRVRPNPRVCGRRGLGRTGSTGRGWCCLSRAQGLCGSAGSGPSWRGRVSVPGACSAAQAPTDPSGI